MQRNIILIFISLIIVLIFINAKPIPNIKPSPEKRDETKKKFLFKPRSKEYYDNLFKKGLKLDDIIPEKERRKEKINYKEDKKRRRALSKSFEKKENKRRLSSTQVLENVGFVDISQKFDYAKSLLAMKYVMNNIKKDDTKLILYPYPFEYQDKNKVEKDKSDTGGFFTLNQTSLNGGTFSYIKNISNVEIGRAKGIYDIDIAILSLLHESDGREEDLFTESKLFCEYFVSTISKISTCIDGKNDYLEYKQRYPSKGAIVYVSGKDILNETLFDSLTGSLKFNLLIIPDYLTGNEETIFSENHLTAEAVEIIKKFRDLGGHIITSGKSGYILELMGILPVDTYDITRTISTQNSDSTNTIYGCQEIYGQSPLEQEDYLKQLICMGYQNKTYLSQIYKMKNIPSNFDSLIKLTNEDTKLVYKEGGYQHDIDDTTVTYDYLLVSKEEESKGRIFIVNGNPVKNLELFNNIRNIILYTMSKNVVYDLNIKFSTLKKDTNSESSENLDEGEGIPIPAGEEGVQLETSYKLYNLYSSPLTNIKLDLLFANKIELVEKPDNCDLIYDDKYLGVENIIEFNKTRYLSCDLNDLDELKFISNSFKIEITDFTITQKLNDISLIYSNLTYTLEDKNIVLTPGIYYAQGQAAALLRGTINKDPSSNYPMEGKGLYFDLVLNVENKENSIAKDVKYIALVPLVSPLYDGKDEGSVARVIPLYEKYYEDHNYSYPWVDIKNRETDYIDYFEVAGKNMCYVNDYDTPVKINVAKRSKITDVLNLYTITEADNDRKIDDYAGSNKGISPTTLLKQLYFGDNERFYETAAPRVSLFVDTAQEEGAKALFGNEIPEEFKDPHNTNKAKQQYCFIRLDTYFYSSLFDQYQLPDGLNDSIIFSIDKFDQSTLTHTDDIFGKIKAHVYNKGHYNSRKEPFDRLKPNEYSNPLLLYNYKNRFDPTNPEQMKVIEELTGDKVRLSHFMVPFLDRSIKHADSLYGFKLSDSYGNGYMEEYPSIKFIFAHSIEIVLAPEITRLGGIAEIILPEGVGFDIEDPVKEDKLTTSADNVAFYKNEYIKEGNKVRFYFRRGLMPNENYGLPSKCKAFIENLDKRENIDITVNIYELKYDFSSKNLESYKLVQTDNTKAFYIPFFSLPCLYMENTITRKSEFDDEISNEMFEYELVNPFARYGGYFQELTKHTTVYGSGEAHHRKDPGFQGISGGFSLISNIGTSSIPFAEFLEHEKLAIPGVTSTSRLEWYDIWGRMWAQNLRSVYPDIPPIPPSPLNFIMTTTFELITDTKNPEDQTRVIEWQSDESVYIRIQMKMRNTYKLYWEPTFCKENQIPFIKESLSEYGNPIFIPDLVERAEPSIGSEHDVNLGFSSVYGVCYDDNSYIGGQRVTSAILNEMKNMMMCSATENPIKMTECSERAESLNLPIVKRRPDTITDETDPTPNANWNYSPLIEKYLPDGYISTNEMWQLNIDGYSDDEFWKGYPWHLDDCIPNLDNYIIKPHDIIAFPIYKGIGYNMTYSRDYSLYKFPEYKGWWSDQLQNKDHTLLAGQQKVSQVSVGHPSLLKDSDWINGFDLNNPKYNIKNRMKNLYVCMFNRHRVKVTPGQGKYSFLKNVYQNNVVPILPDLLEDDPRYKNYDCLKETPYQYSIYNISQVDNRVYTGNDRDWLYFAAGLRGNAMEDINVIMKLEPIEATKFEGITKVQDGGRFVYWQPPDGPNSYQYYDGNVNTVISKRVDLTIEHKMFPTSLYTFNTYTYELFDIKDEKEKNREYTLNTYMNSHGYGDATTTVYVGGVDATSCKVEPGTHTIVKIVFYNNAGFDWKMKEGAITLNDTAYQVYLNAMNIMSNKVTAVQYPSEYKFMTYEIPDEIKDYVTLTPSQHVMDVSPQFFDLTFNNILTIKDALEGDYFYCLNVSDNFPNELKGKFWEIKMTLHEEWFDTLPSLNDPTGIHDYHLTIPSIRFGVPISEGENAGKIFYNLGQANEMVYSFLMYKEFQIKGIKLVNEDIINQLSIAVSDNKNKFDNLMSLWNNISAEKSLMDKIDIFITPNDTFYNLITVNLTRAFPLFPYEEAANKPFASELHLLFQTYSDYVPHGRRNLLKYTTIIYNDGRKKKEMSTYPNYISCTTSGPSFEPSFEYRLHDYNNKDMDNQIIYAGDTSIIKSTITVKNEGTDTAYNTNIKIFFDSSAKYISMPQSTSSIKIKLEDNKNDLEENIISISYSLRVEPKDEIKFDLYFEMQFEQQAAIDLGRNLEEETEKQAPLIKGMQISLCLADVKCKEGDSNYGKQSPDFNQNIPYKVYSRAIGKISLSAENIGTNLMPKYVLKATITDISEGYNLKDVEYSFRRKIIGVNDRYREIALTKNNTIIDEPFEEGEIDIKKNYTIYYKVIGEFPDGRTLDSLNQNEYMDSYSLVEENNTKDGFPSYAIIIISVVGAAAVIGTAILVYRLLSAKSVLSEIGPTSVENPSVKISKFEKIENTSTVRSKRVVKNKNNTLAVSNNFN